MQPFCLSVLCVRVCVVNGHACRMCWNGFISQVPRGAGRAKPRWELWWHHLCVCVFSAVLREDVCVCPLIQEDPRAGTQRDTQTTQLHDVCLFHAHSALHSATCSARLSPLLCKTSTSYQDFFVFSGRKLRPQAWRRWLSALPCQYKTVPIQWRSRLGQQNA